MRRHAWWCALGVLVIACGSNDDPATDTEDGGSAGVSGTSAGNGGDAGDGSGGSGGAGGSTAVGGSSGIAGSGGVAGGAGAAGLGGNAGAAGSGALIPALSTCAPTATACDPHVAGTGLHASLRKDIFLAKSAYDEPVSDPVNGGRLTIVGTASESGSVASVSVQGKLQLELAGSGKNATATLPADDTLDWLTVWPRDVVAGEPVWVAFHSRQSWLDSAATIAIDVKLASGASALAGQVAAAVPDVVLSYVTTNVARDALFVHVRNASSSPRTLAKLWVDEHDVTAAACIPKTTLAPGENALWTVPLCAPKAPGSLWSVRLELASGTGAVAGGRVILPHYPIHTWPSSADCPFPGGNASAHQEHVSHGFDTFFVKGGTYDNSGCNQIASAVAVTNLAAAGLWSMPAANVQKGEYTAQSQVAARFVGDEADATNEAGISEATRNEVKQSLESWLADPEIPTYVGGSRNRWMGTFSGVTDLQGMDFYVAACAPHITAWGKHPPLRGAYDYLSVAARNHAPLPTWLYTQGLSEVWDTELGGTTTYRQPNAAEFRIQAMSVLAAGGKGLMYFQTKLEQAGEYPDTWSAIGAFNRDVRSIRRLLREASTTGLASASGEVIVEALRHAEAIIVPVISLKSASGPTDLGCVLPTANPHWVLADQTTSVAVDVPDDFAVFDAFEIQSGTISDPAVQVTGRTLTLGPVTLGNSTPVRLFVLAPSSALRAEVQSLLQ